MTQKFIDDDFVVVRATASGSGRRIMTLAFGDEVELLGPPAGDWQEVRIVNWVDGQAKGFIKASAGLRDDPLVRFSMVDVQQGDGMVFETPAGKIVLLDAGDNKLFARHVAARFRHRNPTPAAPLEVEAIVISHGDADHFDGLNELRRSEDLPASSAEKRLPIHPKRVFTNGLVKAPSNVDDEDQFGRKVDHDGRRYAIDLFDDPRDAGAANMSEPFKSFKASLDLWEQRGPIEFHRVDASMDPADLFAFLAAEGISVELLGPFADPVPDPAGPGTVTGLRWFPAPKKAPEIHLETGGAGVGSPSVSHTINGHSIGLRLTYGNVRFVLTGDMNKASMALLRDRLDESLLEGEFVKAPHHGSHEFDLAAMKATRPVVTAVSSGDERSFVEYIHPRATLMAALGQSMRGDTGLVFSTELAAFFSYRNESYARADLADWFGDRSAETFTGAQLKDMFTGVLQPGDPPGLFQGFERTNFGIIHVRTDGERVLVFTHSGKAGLNEAYRFRVTLGPLGDRQIAFENLETA